MSVLDDVHTGIEGERITDLRRRVRAAMERDPVRWACPERIDEAYMSEPLPVRKARAIALKLSQMPSDMWDDQLLAGSMTLEDPCVHAEGGFPDYATEEEKEAAAEKGMSTRSCFGHIVPNYERLLTKGIRGILKDVEDQRPSASTPDETAFLDSVDVSLTGVLHYAERLADRCEQEADAARDFERAQELHQMAANLRKSPAGPAETFWQAVQSVWLLHMIFHSTMNGNAVGRLDQYAWPLLEADLEDGRLDLVQAQELVDCFSLKFNERAKATEEQHSDARADEPLDFSRRTRHTTSSQLGRKRDSLDATNHWLQNIIIGGLTPEGEDGTNPLTFLLLDAYRRNKMTNPLLTVRVHRESPEELLLACSEVLREGGGMPAVFNDEALVPALEDLGIPRRDALDYTNDGCWEVLIPGRTDFRFQRLSLMLCLEWALNRGASRLDGQAFGPDTGDPRSMASFDDVWCAFHTQLEYMVSRVVDRVVETVDDRNCIAPVPMLSALIDGSIESRKDMTAGGARFRTFGMLAESASHAIDSLCALKTVVFEQGEATMAEICDALETNFEGHGSLRRKLLSAPHYGNDDPAADAMGQKVMGAFFDAVRRQATSRETEVLFPCGAATFSWYIGIGEGLGPSADGRLKGEPVASNFSPGLGRDMDGVCAAMLSYSKMHPERMAAGGPLDLRLARKLVEGEEGLQRMSGLIKGFCELGGSMMTLTVADTEELKAAQREPEKYQSLRVRMGGWSAYFTMLSREQQDHHIRRQEGRN